MENSINPSKIRSALKKIIEAKADLEAALADAERPAPNPYPVPAKMVARKGAKRRGI